MRNVLCILMVLYAISSVQAAVSVNWQSEGAAGPAPGSTDESSVVTDGTLVYAYNFGAADTLAANGVTFEGTAAGAVASVGGGNITFVNTDSGANAGFNNLTSNLGTLLDSARWAPRTAVGETVQLNNLTAGKSYLVQFYSSDTRAGKNNLLTLDDGTANEYTTTIGNGSGGTGTGIFIIGMFIADATGTAQFTYAHSVVAGNANMNILQVRELMGGPIAILSTTAGSTVYGNFTVDIDFTEAVTGLAESDFSVVNGTVMASSLSGSGANWSVVIIPTVSGAVSVTLPAGSVIDGESNPNPESNTLVKNYVLPTTFVHPGIGVSIEDLVHVKARLNVEPWKTGYNDMSSNSLSQLSYTMQGPFAEVGRITNNSAWNNDMEAVHCLARMWYFTGNSAYAQKARDILIAWATTHTLWNTESGTYLSMGYECMHVFEGADILRGTWPGWTQSDTNTVKAYFENVWWDEYHISVPYPLRSANQGMAQFTAALGVAIFNDDQEKFDQCLNSFLIDASAALGSTLSNGQIGDTGRDAHDQGQLMLMAWAAEAFWKQGVDVYSVFDNRMLAAIEYLSRYNLLVDTPFIQFGTVYDIYPEIHTFDGEYESWSIESKMLTLLHSAYVVRKGMRSPYLETYFTCATQSKDTFHYLKAADTSTATPPAPVTPPAGVASVTSLNQANIGDCTGGSATYNVGTKTWTVTGRGSSLSASSADYRFAYLPVTGNATIIAKVTSLSGSDSNARAGVVITETLSENSDMQAMVLTNPNGDNKLWSFRQGAVFGSGSPDGGAASHEYPRMVPPDGQYWVKIERIGNRINSYSSPDGASWSCGESADYVLGSTAYVGLAVSSDDNSSLATATFTNVRITGGNGLEASTVPPAPYAIYASPGGDQIPLRWLESFEATSYKIWRTTTPGGPYTLITEQTGTSYIDTDVVFGTQYYYAVSGVNSAGEGPLSPEATHTKPYMDFYEAENYSAQSGTGLEDTRDFFGGKDVGWISAGDWCRYDGITIKTGAVFQVRCAGYNDPVGTIEVRLGSTSGTLVGSVQPIYTGGAQNWATTETTLSAAAVGTQNLCLVFRNALTGTTPGINLNWFNIVYPYSPYGGSPRSIPGLIEAEEYNLGGEGGAYHDTTPDNAGGAFRDDDVDIAEGDGGYIVGWTSAGEWLEYTVNAASGTYAVNLRAATPYDSQQIVVTLNGVLLKTIDLPNTGSWTSYQTVSVNDVLVSGGSDQILRIEFPNGNVNLNWLQFILPVDGDLTLDGKVNMEDVAELSADWQSDYTMDDLLISRLLFCNEV